MSLFPQLQVTEVILQRSKLMATLQTVSGSDCIAGSVTVPLKWKPIKEREERVQLLHSDATKYFNSLKCVVLDSSKKNI